MSSVRRITIVFTMSAILAGSLICHLTATPAYAQGRLTFPEIITALQSKLPNQSFRTRTELVTWMITQIRRRKMDKPLTPDREDDLRQAGATDQLIEAIRANSPAPPAPTPTPVPPPVDLGDLTVHAVNLVKPEYTAEARRARTMGEVKLSLELDETGRVVSVTRLTTLPNGLAERSVEAARQSTFRPATRDGKPVRSTGILNYNFRLNLVDVAATLAAAHDLRVRRECDRAIVEYGRVVNVEPGHAKALMGRALCYVSVGDYEAAAADLGKASESDPRDSDIFFFLAVTLDMKGEHLDAAKNYKKALALRPELDSQATFDCLFIDRSQMTHEQARNAANPIISACSQAVRNATEPLLTLLHLKRGIGYRMRADFDKAIAELENVRRTSPQLTAVNAQLQIAYNGRGLEAFNKKEYKRAFDDVSLAIHADPQNPTPYINRCAIYLYAWKQYGEAIEDCSEAIRLATRSSSAYNYRGYAYEMTKSRAKALADYKMALDLDPQNRAARTNLNRLEQASPTMKHNY
jgi:tetratricopeptide (TPR) repeat protein